MYDFFYGPTVPEINYSILFYSMISPLFWIPPMHVKLDDTSSSCMSFLCLTSRQLREEICEEVLNQTHWVDNLPSNKHEYSVRIISLILRTQIACTFDFTFCYTCRPYLATSPLARVVEAGAAAAAGVAVDVVDVLADGGAAPGVVNGAVVDDGTMVDVALDVTKVVTDVVAAVGVFAAVDEEFVVDAIWTSLDVVALFSHMLTGSFGYTLHGVDFSVLSLVMQSGRKSLLQNCTHLTGTHAHVRTHTHARTHARTHAHTHTHGYIKRV